MIHFLQCQYFSLTYKSLSVLTLVRATVRYSILADATVDGDLIPVSVESLHETESLSAKTVVQAAHFDQRVELDPAFIDRVDSMALEALVDVKIGRFLDQLGKFYPDGLYDLIMSKVEKPLLGQILRRTGGNQVHASRILGINRNTLRKKMKIHGFAP
jgi:Fis family transcriptional regulator